MWFRDDRRSTEYNRLERFLESRDVIRYTKDGVFVVLQLVSLAGSYLNDELSYDIYDFYLVSKPAQIRKQVHRETILLLDELEVKLNLHVKWTILRYLLLIILYK